ncbi:MAG: integrase, partial [Oscillospiraceae bacterium]|nr:integrase [Oscillospiraceae bacterium]
GKVYPHSLRSLFSRMVHGVDGDMALLADILGHSDINTTRLYVRESTARYRRIIDGLGLARMRYTANTT